MSTQKVFPSKGHSSKLTKGKELGHIISQLELTPEVKDLLKANQKNLNNIKIVVKNGEISLKVINNETNKHSLVRYETVDTTQKSTTSVRIFKQFSSTILKDLGPVALASHQSNPIVTLRNGPKVVEKASTHVNGNASSNPTKHKITSPPLSKPSTPQLNKPSTPTARPKMKPQLLKRMKILLAIGPHSLKELSNKLKISTPDVSSMIETIAQVYNPNKQFPKLRYLKPYKQIIEDSYVLKYQLYREMRLIDFPTSLSPDEMKIIRRTFEVIYNDVLKLDARDPARAQLKSAKPSSPLSSSSTSSNFSHNESSSVASSAPNSSKPTPIPYTHSRTPSLGNTPSRSINGPSEPKKRKLEVDKDNDYFCDLAERFRSKYKEYESLYRAINNQNDQMIESNENLEKLFEMHRVLEGWKTQLWKSVENA